MLVVAQEESPAARVERRAALDGSAIDDGRRSIREELPLAKPLRLERGWDHEQPTADASGAPEDMARGDGLRGLAEAHVIGKEQTPTHEEPPDSLALVRIERLLEAPQRFAQLCDASGALDLARKAPAVFLEQRVQRRLGAPVPEEAQQQVHDRQPRFGRRRDVERPAVTVAGTEPAAQIPVRRTADPADASQPVAGTRQRSDRIPTERR